MRVLKIILIVSAIVGVLGGLGIYFLLPSTINWGGFTEDFSAQIERVTGNRLMIEGAPVFTWGTVPVLKTGRVVLKNKKGGKYPDLMSAPSAEFTFDAGALLRRKIVIRKITLSKPDLFIEELAQGDWNYYFGIMRHETMAKNAEEKSFSFDSILFSDGTVHLQELDAPEAVWNNFSAEMFAESLDGPFSLEGTLKLWGGDWRFSMKVPKMTTADLPRFALTLINVPAETVLRFNGGFEAGKTNVLDGSLDFDIRKPDVAYKMFVADKPLPKALSAPLSGTMVMRYDTQTTAFTFKELLFKFGDSSAAGQVTRTVGADAVAALSGVLNISQFDPEPFLKDAAELTSFIVAVTRENAGDVLDFDFNLDTFEYNRDNIRSLKFNVHSDAGVLKINDVTASLPGGMVLNGKGTVSTDGDVPVFAGNFSAETENIGTVLRWLKVPKADTVSQNLLRSFVAKGDFKISSRAVDLSSLTLKLDLIEGTGALTYPFDDTDLVSVTADLNDLNLDAYFPDRRNATKDFLEKIRQKSLSDQVKALFVAAEPLNTFDLRLALAVKLLTVGDIKMQNVVADGELRKGILSLERLSADDVFKSSVGLSGTMTGFGGMPTFPEKGVAFFVETKQLRALTKEFGVTLPMDFERFAGSDSLTLKTVCAGNLEKMNANIVASFGAFSFDARGRFEQTSDGGLDFDVGVSRMTHDNLRNFVRFFADKYRPIAQKQPRVTFAGRVMKKGTLYAVEIGTGSKIDNDGVTGKFSVNAADGQPVSVTADLAFSDALDVSPLLPDMKIRMQEVAGAGEKPLLAFLGEPIAFQKTPADFSFLGNYKAQVNFTVPVFQMDETVFRDVAGALTIDAKKVHFEFSKAAWNGANVVLAADLDALEQMSFQSTATVTGLKSDKPVFGFKPLDFSFDDLTLSFAVQGKGGSAYDVFESLEGRGTLSLEKPVAYGMDLPQARALLEKGNMSDKDAFSAAVTTGKTFFDSLSVPLEFREHSVFATPVDIRSNGAVYNENKLIYHLGTHDLNAALLLPLTTDKTAPKLSKVIDGKTDGTLTLKTNDAEVFDFFVKSRLEAIRKEEAEKAERLAREIEAQKRDLEEKRAVLAPLAAQMTADADAADKQVSVLTEMIQKGAVVDESLVFKMQTKAKSIRDFAAGLENLLKKDAVTDDDVRRAKETVSGEMETLKKDMAETYKTAVTDEYQRKIRATYASAADVMRVLVQKNVETPEVRDPAVRARIVFEAMEKRMRDNERETDEKKLTAVLAEMDGDFQKMNAEVVQFDKDVDVWVAKQKAEAQAREQARLKAEEEARLKREAEEKAQAALAQEQVQNVQKTETSKAAVTVIERREGSKTVKIVATPNEDSTDKAVSAPVEKTSVVVPLKAVIQRHDKTKTVSVTSETQDSDVSFDVAPAAEKIPVGGTIIRK